jgi:hypothetical protein
MSQTSQGKSVLAQGRIVWLAGDLFKGKVKLDQNTKQPKIDQKTGQPIIEYGFGLAIPKTELAEGKSGFDLWTTIHNEAYQIYPSRQVPPSFAWKYKDGDGVDHNGIPFGGREGYAGNLVFGLTSQIPMKYFRYENGTYTQINDGIKCGDYVQVQIQVKAHGPIGQGKPGLYLNPMAVLFLGYGAEIINTPSAEQVFGFQAPTLPPGASATPLVPAGAGMPLVAPQPVAPMAPMGGVMSMPQTSPPAFTQSVQPHHAVLPQQFQPQAPAPMPMTMPSIPGMPR